MSAIYFQLLGQPKIFKDKTELIFSYGKIKALLIYLFCQKKVNREELASLLWPNKATSTSRKNLRNCIYQANTIIGYELIISPNRTTLSLNPKLAITGDTDLFLSDPLTHRNLYHGAFLQDFYLKDSGEFEFWVLKMKEKLEAIYSQASYEQLTHYDNDKQFKEKESLLLNLIDMDKFEEQNYFLLMELYKEQNRIGKIIETYYKLVDLFHRELSITPSDRIQHLYTSILQYQTDHSSQSGIHSEFLFERVFEIRLVNLFSTGLPA